MTAHRPQIHVSVRGVASRQRKIAGPNHFDYLDSLTSAVAKCALAMHASKDKRGLVFGGCLPYTA